MTLLCSVVGARPNLMKMAPVIRELNRRGLPQLFVHTGQHYDRQMSDVFVGDLNLPSPDVNLGVGSGSHAEQTAKTMIGFEQLCRQHRFDLVLVAGDVNSTLACALAAAKLLIPIAHIEAGLRSFDRSMPEEINRILTDQLAELLFTTEPSAEYNLRREGIPDDRIHFVGNTMIDSLRSSVAEATGRRPWDSLGLVPGGYGLVTLHRPSNVDGSLALGEICMAMREVAKQLPLVFPVHPRTLAGMRSIGLDWGLVRLIEPLGYLTFLGLMARARLVLTDSGGVQEETTALGLPCITIRPNTERPITTTVGTNRLVAATQSSILGAVRSALCGEWPTGETPPLWDGRAGPRIVDVIERWLGRQPLRRTAQGDA